ncbi:MAG: hypothetical protein ACAH11_14510 [Sphingomonas sp.]
MIHARALLLAAAALLPLGSGVAHAQNVYTEAAMQAFTSCPPVVAKGIDALNRDKLTNAGFEQAPKAEAAKYARGGAQPVVYVRQVDGVPIRLIAYPDNNCWVGVYGEYRIPIRDGYYQSLDTGDLGYARDPFVPLDASPARRAYIKRYTAFTIRITLETAEPTGEEPVVWIKTSKVKD